MSISELKKNRANLLDKLKKAADEQTSNSKKQDNRFWKPTFDKEKGTGTATIRFLPAPNVNDLPYSMVQNYAFKGPTGKWYLEKSLQTLKRPDPVAELFGRLWNSGIESDQQVAKSLLKRNIRYYTNVLVIKDPAKPENEGKVFLYEYGPMIHKIIQDRQFPDTDLNEYEDDGIPVCDPWIGADFVFRISSKIVNGDKVPNYEKSSFKAPSPLFGGDDDKIDEVWQKCFDLKEFAAEESFKSYDELRKRLFEVLGPTVGSGIQVVEGWAAPTREAEAAPVAPAVTPRATRRAEPVEETETETPSASSSDDFDLDSLMAQIR